MSNIFKRIYGRKIPSTKMDAENPAVEETTTPAAEAAVTGGEENTTKTTETTPTTVETTATTTTSENGGQTTAQVTTTETTTQTATTTEQGQQTTTTTTADATTTTTTTATTTTTTPTTNGAPRTFQFGAKAKMFRDMLAQHRLRLDSDQTQLYCIVGILVLACFCSFGALATNYWQCQGDINVGLWNTCQEQTRFTQPETNSTTSDNSTTVSTAIMCAYHNSRNLLDFIVADQARIDQVQASQGLIVCGTIMYVASLIAFVFAYRFIKNKATRNLNMMRNLLVAGIFTQILAFLLQLIGFFLYILTERLSTSVGLLFVYFGLALFATNIINFFTIEYKAYKLRQQQIQLN